MLPTFYLFLSSHFTPGFFFHFLSSFLSCFFLPSCLCAADKGGSCFRWEERVICCLQRRCLLCEFPDTGGCWKHVTSIFPPSEAPTSRLFILYVTGPAGGPHVTSSRSAYSRVGRAGGKKKKKNSPLDHDLGCQRGQKILFLCRHPDFFRFQ